MNLRVFLVFSVLVICSQLALSQKAGRGNVDPDPDEFIMMDKGAELDRKSLQQNFIYPDSAKRAGIQGTVTVQVLIGKTGKAERYIIMEAVHPLLDSAAANAVMKASYKAAIYDTKPLKSWMEIPIIFKIGNKRGTPVEVQGAEEGDGYLRARFNQKNFYDSLDKKILEAAPKGDAKVAIVVDATGHVTEVRKLGNISDELYNEMRRVLMQTPFEASIHNGKYDEDHLTIVIDPHFR